MLLDTIDSPDDLRRLAPGELQRLADEVRRELIATVAITGGHFGAGLGVVELTVALHYVFETPRDVLIWDVSHQAYPHKMLTGRRGRMRTIRQGGGLSGFTRRHESVYDPFGAAHASTSISAGLGMAVARDMAHEHHNVVCVIGDGAFSAGLAYEGLNNLAALGSRLIVILNDNDMSIAPPVGGLACYLARLSAEAGFRPVRDDLARALARFPADSNVRRAGGLFEDLGLAYEGPVDGHDMAQLVETLARLRDGADGPTLLHVVTEKGKGYAPAQEAGDRGHAVAPFSVATGKPVSASSSGPSFTRVFADALIAEAQADPAVVAITAAMPSGTGVDRFAKAFPDRAFDVGIAEQHAVTFAAGLAAGGAKPFCAIYSTFLQRAYDQVVHDVALQQLPVRFAIDRAGLVGADGPTHAGAFDLAYLCCVPGMVVMAAADASELVHMVATSAAYEDGPIAFRYPRGAAPADNVPARGRRLPIGRGRIVMGGDRIAILSLGARLGEVMKAASILASVGLTPTVADARFAKPLDERMVLGLARDHEMLVTIEEGSVGGFGSHVQQLLAERGRLDNGLKLRSMVLPDRFLQQDSADRMYATARLDGEALAARILAALDVDRTRLGRFREWVRSYASSVRGSPT